MHDALVLAARAGDSVPPAQWQPPSSSQANAESPGLALGATMATAVVGGLTPYFAQMLVERTGWAMAPGAMVALMSLSVLPILLAMKETARR